MTLPTTTYSAFRGYGWSPVPSGHSVRELDALYRFISDARGDFPNPLSVEVGLVSDGKTAAAFTIQNVDRWDAEQRASDYGAFALFPVGLADGIDIVELLNHDFFWTPSRTPKPTLDYRGPTSARAPLAALAQLETDGTCLLRDPRSLGAVIRSHGSRGTRWVCLMKPDNTLKVECDGLH